MIELSGTRFEGVNEIHLHYVKTIKDIFLGEYVVLARFDGQEFEFIEGKLLNSDDGLERLQVEYVKLFGGCLAWMDEGIFLELEDGSVICRPLEEIDNIFLSDKCQL